MERSRSFFGELLRPWWVRIWILVTVAIPSYDAAANQLGLPKLPALWGMTGSLLPWWGWLLVFQGALMAALVEYVRRNVSTNGIPQSNLAMSETANSYTPSALVGDFDADQAVLDALAKPRSDGWPSAPHPQPGSIEHAFNELRRLIIAVALKDQLPNVLAEFEQYCGKSRDLWTKYEKAVREPVSPSDPGGYHTTVTHARNAWERSQRDAIGVFQTAGFRWPDEEIEATQIPTPLPKNIEDENTYNAFRFAAAENYIFSKRAEAATADLHRSMMEVRSVIGDEVRRRKGGFMSGGSILEPFSKSHGSAES